MKLFHPLPLLHYLFLLCLLSATASSAMEIHCKTQHIEFDLILKTSPETQKSYALLLSEERLESYQELLATHFAYELNHSFEYRNAEDFISINLQDKQGSSSLVLAPMTEKLELSFCTEYL